MSFESYRVIDELNGSYRIEVALNRLPAEYYPTLDMNDYIPSTLARHKKLEDLLNNSRNKTLKVEFSKKIQKFVHCRIDWRYNLLTEKNNRTSFPKMTK